MVVIGKFMLMESKEEWENNVRQIHSTYFTKKGGSIEKPLTFPAYFNYIDSLDTHFCGEWVETTKDNFDKARLLQINILKEKIKFLENL